METRLTNTEELLFRQLHPCKVNAGRPTSSAFKPTLKDAGKASVALSSLTTAEGAYQFYTNELKLASKGTWGVTVRECEDLGLSAYSSPSEGPPPDPAHGHVSFVELSGPSRIEKAAMLLSRKASDRGCLFAPGVRAGPSVQREADTSAPTPK